MSLECSECEWDARAGHDPDCSRSAESEVKRLQERIARGVELVNDMDLRMPEQAATDEEGWIVSYRIPVGPWHRLLGWARGGSA